MTETTPMTVRMQKWLEAPDERGCIRWSGPHNKNGYGTVRDDMGRTTQAHLAVYRLALGSEIPTGFEVDHECGVRDCVALDHLRLLTRQQNAEHRTSLEARNTSGYPGVTFHKASRKWRAQGKRLGKCITIGHFSNRWDAYQAWVAWARANKPFVSPKMLNLPKQEDV